MGGLHVIGRGAMGFGAAATVGLTVNALTSRATRGEQRARDDWAATKPEERARNLGPYPGVHETQLDAASRWAGVGIGAAAALVGVGALVTRRPVTAVTALGVSLGATAATLLAGSGTPRERVDTNLATLGRGFSAALRTQVHGFAPTVRAQLPLEKPKVEARPTAQQLRAMTLSHLPGTPDRARASAEVDRAMEQIDFSKRDIFIWVPATAEHYLPSAMRKGMEDAGFEGSMALLDYPATFDLPSSAATGMVALQELLARIAEQGGDHRVVLAGHSQGSWVIADTLAEPAAHAMVDRAVLLGNPGFAQAHYADRRDGKVVEVDHEGDVFAAPVADRRGLLEGLDGWNDGDTGAIPELVAGGVQNPLLSGYVAAKAIDPLRWADDPHRYEGAMSDAAAWLAQ